MIISPGLTIEEQEDLKETFISRGLSFNKLISTIAEVQHSKTLEWASEWIETHPSESLKDYIKSLEIKSFTDTLIEALNS